MSSGSTEKSKQLLIWVFMIAVALINSRLVHPCPEKERLGLLHLKAYLHNHSYHHEIFDWSDNGERYNCCAWDRVLCDLSTQRVIKLDLSSNVTNLDSGRYHNKVWLFNVTQLNPFSKLISLDLSKNDIHGLVEHDGSTRISTLKRLHSLVLDDNPLQTDYVFVGALTSLRTLILQHCRLNDSIEALGLVNLTQLQVLKLTDNNFHGPIQGIANMRHLLALDLSWNNLYGSIQGICDLKSLQELNLAQNHLYGGVPSCLYNLTSLQVIDLSHNQLKGIFPHVFSNLTFLETLSLFDNFFEGQLSLSSMANLSKLQTLLLSRSGLEVRTEDSLWKPTFQLQYLELEDCNLNKKNGIVPNFLLHQYNLSYINLSSNNLTGPFPTWLLNNNTQLQILNLQNNSLTGSLLLPSYTKPSLRLLTVSSNHFQGRVPENIGFLFPSLMYLHMSRNHFEGHIPTSITHLGRLQSLDLSRNNFFGELPRGLFNQCYSLTDLIVSDNHLQGEIIPEHMNLTQLILLKASNNSFGGTIKDSLKRSSVLRCLDISYNNIMGQLHGWIGNLRFLKAILLSKNYLHGKIPREICKLQLKYLDLSHNNFTGCLPPCSNFSSLVSLHLYNNKFTGSIPNSLSSCSSLQEVDLRNNLFLGNIPSWINKLFSLRVLQLGGNNLYGEIPYQICQLENLDILDLSRNHLNGGLPTCLWNMSFGLRRIGQDHFDTRTGTGSSVVPVLPYSPHDSIFFFFYCNCVKRGNHRGSITFDTIMFLSYEYLDDQRSHGHYLQEAMGNDGYNLQDAVEVLAKNQYYSYAGGDHLVMSAMDVSCNKLSGDIPPELGDLRQIKSLNLSHNCFSGSIPSSFSNLKQVESLDLSYNLLTGTIPSQLSELNFLAIFNVSFNNLSGRTPEVRQFANFDQSNYLGNPGLCGLAVNKSCHQTNVLPPRTRKEDEGDKDATLYMEDFLWCFGMSSFVAFLTILAVLSINPQWRRAWFDFVECHILWWLL